jgi:hypothetical protein
MHRIVSLTRATKFGQAGKTVLGAQRPEWLPCKLELERGNVFNPVALSTRVAVRGRQSVADTRAFASFCRIRSTMRHRDRLLTDPFHYRLKVLFMQFVRLLIADQGTCWPCRCLGCNPGLLPSVCAAAAVASMRISALVRSSVGFPVLESRRNHCTLGRTPPIVVSSENGSADVSLSLGVIVVKTVVHSADRAATVRVATWPHTFCTDTYHLVWRPAVGLIAVGLRKVVPVTYLVPIQSPVQSSCTYTHLGQRSKVTWVTAFHAHWAAK